MCDFKSVYPTGKNWKIMVGKELDLYDKLLSVGGPTGRNGMCTQYDSDNFEVVNMQYNALGNTGTIGTFQFYRENGFWNLYTSVTPTGDDTPIENIAKNISCASGEHPHQLIYTGNYADGSPLKIYQRGSHSALFFDNINLKAAGVPIPKGVGPYFSIYFKRTNPDFFLANDELLVANDYAIIPHHHDELGDHVVQLRLESESGYAILKNTDSTTLQMVMQAFASNQPVYFSRKESVYHPTIQLIKIGGGELK
jgi:hypothetical protein